MDENKNVNNEELAEENTIVLTDENGNDIEFEFIDLVDYENNEYVILLPVEETDEPGEVVILKVEVDENEEESYVSIDDEDVLGKVFEIFKEKYKDEFDFVDED